MAYTGEFYSDTVGARYAPTPEGGFWCCYVEGTGGFQFQHWTEAQALQEAARLARLSSNRGRKVYVLRTSSFSIVDEVPVKVVAL